MSQTQYTYIPFITIPLAHLKETDLVVSRMIGGGIPDETKQYYINTRYTKNGTQYRTSGFSIQSNQIPQICQELFSLWLKTNPPRTQIVDQLNKLITRAEQTIPGKSP